MAYAEVMVFLITGQRRQKLQSGSSTSSRISTDHITGILERLKNNQNRLSTRNNYYGIWKNFNQFIVRLDKIPRSWEDRFSLFGAHLVDGGAQSSTIRSYASAVKAVLVRDGYPWDDQKVQLSTIIKACKLDNDTVKTRLPIGYGLLELILHSIDVSLGTTQPYLCLLYKSIFLLGYYGLMCIGELTSGSHPIKAPNIHVGQNKDKILIVLYSSKTHGKESRAQKIKIEALGDPTSKETRMNRHYCPFRTIWNYLKVRGPFEEPTEPLFIFRDGKSVTPEHVRTILRQRLKSLGLDPYLYDTHSLRIRCVSDMFNKFNFPVQEIKQRG